MAFGGGGGGGGHRVSLTTTKLQDHIATVRALASLEGEETFAFKIVREKHPKYEAKVEKLEPIFDTAKTLVSNMYQLSKVGGFYNDELLPILEAAFQESANHVSHVAITHNVGRPSEMLLLVPRIKLVQG